MRRAAQGVGEPGRGHHPPAITSILCVSLSSTALTAPRPRGPKQRPLGLLQGQSQLLAGNSCGGKGEKGSLFPRRRVGWDAGRGKAWRMDGDETHGVGRGWKEREECRNVRVQERHV